MAAVRVTPFNRKGRRRTILFVLPVILAVDAPARPRSTLPLQLVPVATSVAAFVTTTSAAPLTPQRPRKSPLAHRHRLVQCGPRPRAEREGAQHPGLSRGARHVCVNMTIVPEGTDADAIRAAGRTGAEAEVRS